MALRLRERRARQMAARGRYAAEIRKARLAGKDPMSFSTMFLVFVMIESGGNNEVIGDGGTALGCLQIRPIMVRAYNQDHPGMMIRHQDVKRHTVQSKILNWWWHKMERKYGRELTCGEVYRTWNAGEDALIKRQAVARGRRAQALYVGLKKRGNQ